MKKVKINNLINLVVIINNLKNNNNQKSLNEKIK